MIQYESEAGESRMKIAQTKLNYPAGHSIDKTIDIMLNKAITCRTKDGLVNCLAATLLLNELVTLDDDIDVLTDFTSAAIGNIQVKLVTVNSGGANGQSGAAVFLAQDASGTVVAVTKIFPELEEFVRELSSLQRLRSTEFTSFTVPKPLAAAKMNSSSSIVGVLVSEVAQGQSIADLIIAAGSSTLVSERAVAQAALEQSVIDTARALAELHTVPLGSGGSISDSYLSFHLDMIRHLVSVVAKDPEIYEGVGHLHINELEQRVNNLIQTCRVDISAAALVHGDAHPGNFFWHPSDGVTFIDTSTFHYSMDSVGDPIAAPERDISNFIQRLAYFCRQANISENETQILQRTFMNVYRFHTGSILSECKLQMFGARSVLNKLIETGKRLRYLRFKNLEEAFNDARSDLQADIILLKQALDWLD